MPLYEYECEACGEKIEVIRSFSDPPLVVCPNCGGVLRKLLSSPAFQFKGSGFYLTDYGKAGSAGDRAGEKSDEKKEKEKSSSKGEEGSPSASSAPSTSGSGEAAGTGGSDSSKGKKEGATGGTGAAGAAPSSPAGGPPPAPSKKNPNPKGDAK